VSAGSEHSVALTDSGEVYTWGGDPEGQLGLGSSNESHVQLIPHLVLSLSKFKITEIAAGGAHTLALTGTAKLFYNSQP
jgi:E3 ubiquitin-protein ligase HERC4